MIRYLNNTDTDTLTTKYQHIFIMYKQIIKFVKNKMQGNFCLFTVWPFDVLFRVLPRLGCDAIPQQDFNPMLFPISVQG